MGVTIRLILTIGVLICAVLLIEFIIAAPFIYNKCRINITQRYQIGDYIHGSFPDGVMYWQYDKDSNTITFMQKDNRIRLAFKKNMDIPYLDSDNATKTFSVNNAKLIYVEKDKSYILERSIEASE